MSLDAGSRSPRREAAVEKLEGRVLLSVTTINSGQYKTGTISTSNLHDTYRFAAPAGASLSVTIAETNESYNNGFEPQIDLYGPDGALLQSSNADTGTSIDVTAPRTGTYSVTAHDDNGDAGGAYGLSVFVGPGPQSHDAADGGAIASGHTVNGKIEQGNLDVYTFSAAVGSGLVVTMAETNESYNNGFDPRVDLYGPDGRLIRENSGDTGAQVIVTAPKTGTYYAVARDDDGDYGGTYGLTVFVAPGPQSRDPADGGAIVSGQTVNGKIEQGNLDVYTFSAALGSRLSVTMAETNESYNNGFDPRILLYGPDGRLLQDRSGDTGTEVDATAPKSGTYSVVAGDDNGDYGGTYSLTVFVGPGPQAHDQGDGGPITSGQTVNGRIEQGNLDVYTFSATAGVDLSVTMTESNESYNNGFDPRIDLYGPDGRRLESSSGDTGAEVDATAPLTGTYYAVAMDDNGDYGGTYGLSVFVGAAAQTHDPGDGGPIVSGRTVSGLIESGNSDVYTFTAAAGDSLSLAMTEANESYNNGFDPRIDLYGPDGGLFQTNSGDTGTEIDATAPLTGTYYAVARDDNGDGGGTYGFGVFVGPGPQAHDAGDGGSIASGQTVNGTIEPGNLDVYTFAAAVGDSLNVTMAETNETYNNGFDPRIDLYGPDGGLVRSSSADTNTSVSATAAQSGTYYAVARDDNGDGGGAYAVSLTEVVGPAPQTVSIAATRAAVSEGGPGTGQFTVSRANVRAWPLVVNYSISGSAINGKDYKALSGIVTIAPNAASATINVSPIAHSLKQPVGTVTLALKSGPGAPVDSAAPAATIDILNSDLPAISGVVFKDANGDKSQGVGEPGLAGWRVFIDGNNDGLYQASEKSVLTDSAGVFSFAMPGPGKYVIRVVPKAGYALTTPAAGAYVFTLTGTGSKNGLAFGEKSLASGLVALDSLLDSRKLFA